MNIKKRDNRFYLSYILTAIRRVEECIEDKDSFVKEFYFEDVLYRNLGNLFEATTHLSDALKQKYQNVDWKKLREIRAVWSHDYFELDMDELWDRVYKDLPVLKDICEKELGVNLQGNNSPKPRP